jgi:hopanoid biosynthesis associated protein HpnK
MARPEGRRRLVVNADDFGRTHAINEAVLAAHREGILTTASLMVTGEACAEAVAMACGAPTLGVGLHLTLVCGRAVLPREQIPGLVDTQGSFPDRPVLAALRYCARPALRNQLRAEIAAQFRTFHATGLVLDHVNGHLHAHLHPVILQLLCEEAVAWGVRQVRLTRDSLELSRQTTGGRWCYRLSHALIFGALAARVEPRFRKAGFRYTDLVVGLLQDGHADEQHLLKLLPRLPPGDLEFYSHPSMDRYRNEFEALVSPRVKTLVHELGIERVRYQDL